MENQEVLEFRTALLDEVALNSEANNELKHTSFVSVFVEYLSDAGFISDFPASDLYPAFWEDASTAHKGMVFLPLYDRNITLGYLITYLQEHLYEMLYFRTLTGLDRQTAEITVIDDLIA